MELDNSEAGKAAHRAYRKANNLCGYCGKTEHKIHNCPTLAARTSVPRQQISNVDICKNDE